MELMQKVRAKHRFPFKVVSHLQMFAFFSRNITVRVNIFHAITNCHLKVQAITE